MSTLYFPSIFPSGWRQMPPGIMLHFLIASLSTTPKLSGTKQYYALGFHRSITQTGQHEDGLSVSGYQLGKLNGWGSWNHLEVSSLTFWRLGLVVGWDLNWQLASKSAQSLCLWCVCGPHCGLQWCVCSCTRPGPAAATL